MMTITKTADETLGESRKQSNSEQERQGPLALSFGETDTGFCAQAYTVSEGPRQMGSFIGSLVRTLRRRSSTSTKNAGGGEKTRRR